MWWLVGAWAAIVPASEVSFDVAVSGTIAEIEVRQTFRNDSRGRVDATYRFPLHDDAVVDGMQIRLEDRTIEGVIKEKEEARQAYEEAVAQGKTAALTETERWNLYRQQVGNIPPGAELEVIPGMGHDLPAGVWPIIVEALMRRLDTPAPASGLRQAV